MGDFVWNFVFFIILIGILVTIHELGHFLAARFFGVKVYRFSIGFGPVLFRHVGKDGVEYALSLLPLGGYVKMKGEADDHIQGYDKKLAQQDDASKNKAQEKTTGQTKTNADAPNTTHAAQDKSTLVADTDFAELRTGYAADYELESELGNDSFATLSCWKRFVVMFAGPFFNIVLAFFLFIIVNLIGVTSVKPVVGDIIPESIADLNGLHTYDLILQVGDHEVLDWGGILTEIVATDGKQIDFTVSGHKGTEPAHVVTLDFSGADFTPDFNLFDYLGFIPAHAKLSSSLGIIDENSAAYESGVQIGDKVIAVNGVLTPNWATVSYELKQGKVGDKSIELTIVRKKGAEKTNPQAPDYPPLQSVVINNYEVTLPNLVRGVVERYPNSSFAVDMHNENLENYYLIKIALTPKLIVDEKTQQQRPFVGIGIYAERDEELVFVRQYGLLESITEAFHDTAYMSTVIVKTLKKLIVGDLSLTNVSGPVSMAVVAGESASVGIEYFLWIMAIISINLGVFNLLPVPVLDGGQIVYVIYEAITKRKPNEKMQTVLTTICLALLLSLMAFAIFNDIINLF